MTDRAKKLKDIVKPRAASGVSNTDPGQLGQYSATNLVKESPSLEKYLQSRGYNPKTVPKDVKIAHSKSNAFKTWQMQHMYESGEKTPIENIPADKNKTPSDAMMSYASKNKAKHIPSHEIKNPPGTLKREDLDYMAPKADFVKKELKSILNRKKPGEISFKEASDMMGDPKSATISPADGSPKESDVQRKMSKRAKLLLDIKKKSLKEDLYDHEKADKSVATYGKKPKIDTAEKFDETGKDKPKAAAVMSGGTTLTGQSRDTVEIDPAMRVRPGQPDPTKDKDKDKDKKKDEKKKE
jgi:hypothetical protein